MDRILIGENIKRMRLQKGVTQEQLAEAVGVSAVAVSKWERNETMPDISLLPGLAYFFQVSIDELMSYDAAKVQREIRAFVQEHTEAAERYDQKKCLALSKAAYKKYPNYYEVMELYMWDVIGGYADNDPEVVLMHAEELEKITDRILDGCKDSFIRTDAYVMKGKILHAQGQTEDAAMLYREQLPDWYQTAGQKTEQLFAKDSPEFADALRKNTDELVRFALNKLSKELWFCGEGTPEEKVRKAVQICGILKEFRSVLDPKRVDLWIDGMVQDTEAKITAFGGAEERLIDLIKTV